MTAPGPNGHLILDLTADVALEHALRKRDKIRVTLPGLPSGTAFIFAPLY
jgi:hypothetical protein